MFADFTNPGVFADIFLLNFHFLVVFIIQLRDIGLAGLNIVQRSRWSLADFCQHSSVNQMDAGLKLSRHNHA